MNQSKVKEAIVQYRNALRQDPRFGEARYKLAEAYVEDNQLTAAAREYMRAADLLSRTRRRRSRPGASCCCHDSSKTRRPARTTRSRSIRRMSKRRCCSAMRWRASKTSTVRLKSFRKPSSWIPQTRSDTSASARSRRRRGGRTKPNKPSESDQADPTSLVGHLALANFYWATRKPDEALETLHLAFKLEPNHPLVNRMLALFLVTMGKPADAEPYFRKLADLSNDTTAKITLADYYIAAGRSKDAVPLLEQLASHKQTRTAAELRLAELAFQEAVTSQDRRRCR